MDKQEITRLITVAAGREQADVVIRGAFIADVFSGVFRRADVSIAGGLIAGVDPWRDDFPPTVPYRGAVTIDAAGKYLLPALIDGHIHIESSFLAPQELARILVPRGTGTIVADPHEIANVCGLAGLAYMMEAAARAALDVKFMIPSCVPTVSFEHTGAAIGAADMDVPLQDGRILGLGELMNYPGVLNADGMVLDKILLAKRHGKLVDGHSPGVTGRDLAAYLAAGIISDHECVTADAVRERIALGMYVLLRQGSACHDLLKLLPALTPENSRRCLFCSDDLQPRTILEAGHIDNHLRMAVAAGLDPMTAVRMATLNAAECYRLHDRGAVAPGRRADLILVDNLRDFTVEQTWLSGKLVAEQGRYLLPISPVGDGDCAASPVFRTMHVRDFRRDKLRLSLTGSEVWVIDLSGDGIVTGKGRARVSRDPGGYFVHDPAADVAKIAVVERHKMTGNVGVGLIRGYGIKRGAVALSVSHDSHNIITVGTTDRDMAFAVERLIALGGGIVLANDGVVVEELALPIAGLMSDQNAEHIAAKLAALHHAAVANLGVNADLEPVLSLAFMSLVVIPALKITDQGLFDVEAFRFIPAEPEGGAGEALARTPPGSCQSPRSPESRT
jgi:adenine deaminase